jgi:hypothetical protein
VLCAVQLLILRRTEPCLDEEDTWLFSAERVVVWIVHEAFILWAFKSGFRKWEIVSVRVKSTNASTFKT